MINEGQETMGCHKLKIQKKMKFMDAYGILRII